MWSSKPARFALFFAACASLFVLWACHLEAEEKPYFDIKTDPSWMTYDSIKVVLQDEDGVALDTLFKGKLTTPDALQKLDAKGYAGERVRIVILGFTADKLAKSETRPYDGSTGKSGEKVVVIIPIGPDKPDPDPDPKDTTVLDVKPDTFTIYTGGATRVLAPVGAGWAGKALAWSSSAPGVASVENGIVTPIGKGKAWIKAVYGAKADSSEATVAVDAPVLDAGADTAVRLGTTVAFSVKATQAYGVIESFKWSLDGDTLWDDSASGFPADKAVFTAPARKFDKEGPITLRFQVRDGEKNLATADRKLTVTNKLPRIVSLEKDAEITVGDTVAFVGKVEALGGGALKRYEFDFGDGSAAQRGDLSGTSATVNGGRRYAKEGTFKVTLTVEDDGGTAVGSQVTVKVNPPAPKRPPVANAGKDTSVLAGTRIDLHGSATDPDGTVKTLEWSIAGGPFQIRKGDTSFASSAAGTLECILRATDDDGLEDKDTVLITVSKSQPPAIQDLLPKDTTITIKDSLSFSAKVTGQVALKSFSWDFTNDGNADETGPLSAATAELKTGLRFPNEGAFPITLKVTDNLDGVATAQFTVTVVKDAPTADAGKDTTVAAGTRANLRGKAADGKGTLKKIEWRIGTGTYFESPLDTFFLAPALGGVSIPCYLKVTDDDGLIDEDTVEVTVAPETNANLSALALSSGTLAPAFSAGVTAYTAAIANATASITVTATVAGAGSTLKVNGTAVASGSASAALPMAVGPNTVSVEVTAQNGGKKTYEITVTRAASSVNTLSALAASAGALAPAFASGTTAYTVTTTDTVTTITPTITAGSLATVKVNGAAVASGSPSASIKVPGGAATPITVAVTAQDGTVRNYVITFKRAGWADVGTASDVSGYVSGKLLFDDTIPYIAYYHSAGISVKKLVNGAWTSVGAATLGAAGVAYLDFEIHAGVPYLSFKDPASDGKITVVKYTTGPNWLPVGARGFSDGAIRNTNLAISPTGVPYVTYQDEVNGFKAAIMTFNGTSWVPVGTGFSAAVGGEPQLNFLGSTLCLGYDINNGKVQMERWTGSAWTILLASATIPEQTNYDTEYMVASDGYLYLSFTAQGGGTFVMWRYGGATPAWSKVSLTGLPAAPDDYQVFANAATAPHLLVSDPAVGGLRTAMAFNGTSWTKVTASPGLVPGATVYPSFAMSKGVPWAVYRYKVSKYVANP